MATITPQLTADEIDDWFKIGQNVAKKNALAEAKPVAVSALGGRAFDPSTGGSFNPDSKRSADVRLPRYRRSGQVPQRQQYVEAYRQKEQEELLSQASCQASGRHTPDSMVDQLERLELDSTMHGGSIGIPEALIPDGSMDVYKNYEFKHNYQHLPILDAQEEIISTIESNQVTIIQGPTGSGKTTQVPQFILDRYAEESRYCNIVVTQPRKIAALSIAQRVCDERGWSLGSVCGYQIGLDCKASEDTRIMYCTTGVLKEKLIRKKNMHEFTHIILDEVHERDIESDFALLIVKKLLRANSPHVRVILMSATFDTEAFAQFFALPVRDKLEPAPVISVGSAHHQVSEFFADDLISKLGEVPPVDAAQPGIHPAMYDMVLALIKEFDLLEVKEQGSLQSDFAKTRGTVLIFLPGYHEICEMRDRIWEIKESHFLTPIPLHSTITLDEQNRVFKKAAMGYRKVILSTNIAESSITVPDIKYVIDFCLTKNLCCDPETNYTQLQLEWASKANTKQRKGRAGRVSNGRVYFMIPRWFYEELEDYGIPEMQRTALDSLVLKTKIFNMGAPKELLALALSPPNLDDIERTILSLKEVGALSSSVGEMSSPYDGNLTFIGNVLAGLPVDIRIGKLLVLGHVFGVLEECLIIGAALSVKSIFARPMEAKLEAFKLKLAWSHNSLSDCIAILSAYKTWDERTRMKEFQRAGQTEMEWARKSFIQIKTIREVAKLVTELEQRLARFNIVIPKHTPRSQKMSHANRTQFIIKLVLCGAFYPNYAVNLETDEKEAVKILSNNDPLRTVIVKGLPMNQGILYEKQIRDIFSACSKDPPPVISTEESRQLRLKMCLNMLDKAETARIMAELEKTRSLRGTRDLRSNRLKASTEVKAPLGHVVNIDPSLTAMVVYVSEVLECGHFWASCCDHESMTLLQQIQGQLNSSELKGLEHKLLEGDLVAAPFEDGCMYRARVEKVMPTPVQVAGGMVKSILNTRVFYVDYGNTSDVHVSRLRALPAFCRNKPFLALEFYLKDIRPSSVRCPDGEWSAEANKLFRRMALEKTLMVQVYSVVDNKVRVDLVEKTPSGQELILNQELVRMGFADTCEENFLSQQNHEWRASQERFGQCQSSVQPDTWLQVDMSTQTKETPQSEGRHRGRKIFLTGPVNPLEMSFSSITLSGRQRVVRIDPESVNSVAIDSQPMEKISRLMVASFMGLNPSGNSMIARDTTIMPVVPGLPALVTLLFAPYAEFRTDPKGERYTGALCGLGYDADNLPILPDHDIELTFETEFDVNDIFMINKVRMAINMAVGTEEAVLDWSSDIFTGLQNRARTQLLDIFRKRRELVNPHSFNKIYMWNQVEEEDILHHEVDDTEANSPALLPLHNAIALSEPQLRPDSKEYFQQHIKELQKVVSSHQRSPVTCKLCKVTLATSQILAIHIETESHIRKEKRVEEGTFKP